MATAACFHCQPRMKKTLIILGLLITIVYFRHVPFALLSPSIDGVKCYSLFVSGGSSNGYAYFLYESPLLTIVTGNETVWRKCTKLNKNIDNIINNITDWPKNGPYYVANKATSNGYFAYIRIDKKVLYIRGFPDFGGAAPSDAEKNICN